MSDDLMDLLHDAWCRIKPQLERDPAELKRRLARRNSGMMRRPPRAWCLAVRANDTRIHSGSALCVPELAGYPRDLLNGQEPLDVPHDVTITAKLLRRICKAVYCPTPGVDMHWLMRELGCSLHNIKAAVRCGVFKVHKVPHYNGRPGHPIPVLYTDRPLDPSARLREHADIVWGTMWKWLIDRVPRDLEQTVQRVPELMPNPQNPGCSQFGGWKWVCPKCEQTCRTLFYPLEPVYQIDLAGSLQRAAGSEEVATDGALMSTDENSSESIGGNQCPNGGKKSFACMRCHNVLYFSRINMRTWNHLISHLSDGLLYGREVKRPGWYVQQRKRAFHPVLRREPSKRRQQVLELLMQNLTYAEVGERLGISKSAVSTYAQEIYRQHGWKGVKELRERSQEMQRREEVEPQMNADERRCEVSVSRVVRAPGSLFLKDEG